MSDRPLVVLSQPVFPETEALLAPHARLWRNDSGATLPREELLRRCAQADALMAFMPDWVDDAFLTQCPRLRIIAGALKGYDNFDLTACDAHGVWFSIVPDLLTAPTAELTLALALGLGRHLRPGDAHVRGGHFAGWEPRFYGRGLHGARVGILGMGNLGRALAQLLRPFAVDLRYVDAREAPDWGPPQPLDAVLSHSEFLFVTLPLTADTRHLVDARALAQLPPGALVINTGRGSVVAEQAVADALAAGHLAGYGADVFEFEDWLLPDRPRAIPQALLNQGDKVLFTPHLGSATVSARRGIEAAAAENILAVLRGEAPPQGINRPRAPRPA